MNEKTIMQDDEGDYVPINKVTASGNNEYVDKLVPQEIQQKIKNILNVAETGSIKGNYSNVSIYDDGKQGSVQITYGRSQTTEQGNLGRLVQMYVDNQGQYSTDFKPYLTDLGVKPLHEDMVFINALKLAGKDPIMQATQDLFFDREYYYPACEWFKNHSFTFPLSLLVIYDSFIHSGGILPFLRGRFEAKTPVDRGNEIEWISQYLKVRCDWLKTHKNPLLRASVYRVESYMVQVQIGNWRLMQTVMMNHVAVNVIPINKNKNIA